MKGKDLTGRKFNHLTALEIDKEKSNKTRVYWKCRCDCGNITSVTTNKLVSLHTKSCGCAKRLSQLEDLTGKTYSHITVKSFAYVNSNNKKAYWNCVCDCGKEIVVQGKLLKNEHKTSCGCHKGENSIIDMTGKKFGKLTVVSSAERNIRGKIQWNCICECGNKVTVEGISLRSGNTKTCGCSRHKTDKGRKNLQGKVFSSLTVLNYAYTRAKKAYWECECSCGRKRTVSSTNLIWGYVRSCDYCAKHSSVSEKEVFNFVKSIYKGEVKSDDRELIAPKEIDIYIPEKHFAIEFNGLYWHCDAVRTSNTYHLDKTRACLKKGIRLLHIHENEWRDKQDICKSMIASALGIYERKEFARKCEVREIKDKKTAIDFFNNNHIQGAVSKFSLALGLYKGEELLQAVVFGKQHFGKNNDYELYRMVTKINTQVLGGFSKLMEHSPYDTVVSYVALRMFDAKGYLAGKWKIENQAKPSYCITDGVNVFSRHLFKKAECLKRFSNVTEDMTEREMQIKNGFYRLWDCGTYRVRWTR